MKHILTTASFAALGVASLCGGTPFDTPLNRSYYAPAPDLSPMQLNKPWSVSAVLRGFYDDNYTTAPTGFKQESYGFEISPSIGVNFPLERTYIGANYQYSMRYYFDRDEDTADHSHIANLLINHAFTDRVKLSIKDSFAVAQEPEILDPDVKTRLLRSEGDNLRNHGRITLQADLTRLFGITVGYANSFYDYEQSGPGSYSASLDRMEHLGHLDFRWHALPDTDFLVGYQYGQVDYSSDDSLLAVGPYVDPEIRNNRSHFGYVGGDHSFTGQLMASLRLGVQYREYPDAPEEEDDDLSPYVDGSVSYNYTEGSYIQAGLRHAKNQTDVTGLDPSGIALDTDTTTLYASLSHRITPSLTGSLIGQIQHSEFNNGSFDGEKEDLYLVGVNLGYALNQYLGFEVGYNFDRVDSDINFDGLPRSFSRNRVYIGLRGTY